MIPLKVQRARKKFVTAVLRTVGRTDRIRMRIVMLACAYWQGSRDLQEQLELEGCCQSHWEMSHDLALFSAGLILLAALFWPWKIPPHSQPLYSDDGHHRVLCSSPWTYKFINYLAFIGMQCSVGTYPSVCLFFSGLLISHKNRTMHFCHASEFISVFKFMCLSFSRKLWLKFF